jgi:hypothetical protein
LEVGEKREKKEKQNKGGRDTSLVISAAVALSYTEGGLDTYGVVLTERLW